ncbi:hypothetical protein [Aureibaculum luteum]|uniref:hypothetical protein n=1 Tax=Aureibaculum luteum TaxID=1548456 RepID=UPI0013009CC6|nr:hypothetical protein [Aureibaculum luteum]
MDIIIYILIIAVAILSIMHIDFPVRKYVMYGAIIYVLADIGLKAYRKNKKV